MIGMINGKVVFSDGQEVIILTNSGVGYQIHFKSILQEGDETSIYTSQVIRENSQDLYGFASYRDKKFFELLLDVNGVGPKSAFSLLGSLGMEAVRDAIIYENKKVLNSAPGIGPKGAAQIILDLKDKIKKLEIYGHSYTALNKEAPPATHITINHNSIIEDTIVACSQLGFDENDVMSLAQELLDKHEIKKPEQLVHLVLKNIGK